VEAEKVTTEKSARETPRQIRCDNCDGTGQFMDDREHVMRVCPICHGNGHAQPRTPPKLPLWKKIAGWIIGLAVLDMILK
jgi:hypothetical protein